MSKMNKPKLSFVNQFEKINIKTDKNDMSHEVNNDNNDPTFIKIMNAVNQNRNIYISGVGGTGKSYILKKLYEKLKYTHNCALTSTTGISAYNIEGVTLHSWCKIILPSVIPNDMDQWSQYLIKKIKKKSGALQRYRQIDILMIDEVSMLGANYFDVLNFVCMQMRKSEKPFGGIQLILTGDMLQLPPVKDDYPFTSESWKMLNLQYFKLTKAHRFSSQEWVDLLHRARMGKITTQDKILLESRLNKVTDDKSKVVPITLFSKNSDVDDVNQKMLAKLDGDFKICQSRDYIQQKKDDDSKESIELVEVVFPNEVEKNCIADSKISIKVGSQVMLLANLDVECGLANGSKGKVISFDNEVIIVEFDNNVVQEIMPHEFKIEYDDKIFVRMQYPLRLAWAVTIHKCQGLTLSSAQIDIGDSIFSDGQSYVALSRCKNLEGLYLSGLQFSKIKPNYQAMMFEQSFNKTCIEL